eukprot:g5088.t1
MQTLDGRGVLTQALPTIVLLTERLVALGFLCACAQAAREAFQPSMLPIGVLGEKCTWAWFNGNKDPLAALETSREWIVGQKVSRGITMRSYLDSCSGLEGQMWMTELLFQFIFEDEGCFHALVVGREGCFSECLEQLEEEPKDPEKELQVTAWVHFFKGLETHVRAALSPNRGLFDRSAWPVRCEAVRQHCRETRVANHCCQLRLHLEVFAEFLESHGPFILGERSCSADLYGACTLAPALALLPLELHERVSDWLQRCCSEHRLLRGHRVILQTSNSDLAPDAGANPARPFNVWSRLTSCAWRWVLAFGQSALQTSAAELGLTWEHGDGQTALRRKTWRWFYAGPALDPTDPAFAVGSAIVEAPARSCPVEVTKGLKPSFQQLGRIERGRKLEVKEVLKQVDMQYFGKSKPLLVPVGSDRVL